ncbi:cytidylyltransferase domain-containing protein [Paraliobacillus ryukyuensis]|uniref:cytidylyltransferase domain-containing protein n=1 Tax=Paraliobacillus ryukyuensis TaxID=200904 RepID=UPI0009A7B009|nr:glycosyltransferase family protein [Paraliobacillus ryukyuensis]
MKIVAIIQARMGSTRLPGKVLRKIKDESVLAHVVNRVSQSNRVDDIVVATTTNRIDDQIVDEVKKLNCTIYRGSESNVLERYYRAAMKSDGDIIVRITSDCPLIDPIVIDNMLEVFLQEDYALVTNAGNKRTFPRGLDVEIFSKAILLKALSHSTCNYQKEHVTPYMYENEINIYHYKNSKDLSKYRWTLDTIEDYELITVIYEELYKGKHNFYMQDIVKLFEDNEHLINMNAHIVQKKVK